MRHPEPVTWFVRRMMPTLVLVGALAFLVRGASRPLSNTDTYFHLRFGHEFLHGGWSLWSPGSVSTYATNDWLPTQWLPQVLMAALEDVGGLAAVAWLQGLQFVLLAATLTWVTRARADLLPTAVVTVMTLVACQPSLSMRPQVLSYVLMALAVHLWWRATETGRLPWVLVPLTWFWATWHGMWPMTVVVGAAGVLALWLTRHPPRTVLVRAGLVVLGCAVAGAVTPVGPRLYGAVLAVGERSSYFGEWGPPDLTSAPGIALLLVAFPAVLGLRDTEARTVVFVVLGLGMAVASIRTVPLAAVTLAPFAAAALQRAIPQERTPPTRAERLGGPAAAVLALVVLAVIVPRTADEPNEQPDWVDERMSSLAPGTRVLNEWNDGGFVMWAYPQLDLMMHGYGDTFTLAELDRNIAIGSLEPGWDVRVRAADPEVAFLRTDSKLAYALRRSGWTVEHMADDVVLLLPPDESETTASSP